jgi:hypothetical protein
MNRGLWARCSLGACATALGLAGTGIAAGSFRVPRSESWSPPGSLVTASEPTHALRLAVRTDGEAVAGWVQGENSCNAVPPASAEARSSRASATGQTAIVVDRGTIVGGFQPPVILYGSSRECGGAGPLFVALAGSGVAYAAWKGEGILAPWMIAVASAGQRFSAPRELGPPYWQLLGLLQSPNGPVAVVWLRARGTGSPGQPPPVFLEYALLTAEGGLGKTVDVGPLEIREGPGQMALNDAGEFAAVGLDPEGRQVVVVCDPAGKCGWRLLVAGGSRGLLDTREAVALSEDGTVAALASRCRLPRDNPSEEKCVGPGGVWALVRAGDRHWLRSRELSAVGSMNLLWASPFGQGGALALFGEDRGVGKTSLDWASLGSGVHGFARPVAADAVAASDESEFAANEAGGYVLAGATAAPEPGRCCVIAISGHVDRPPRTQLLPGSEESPKEVQVGIDGAGDGIALWNDDIGDGFGHGIGISILRG